MNRREFLCATMVAMLARSATAMEERFLLTAKGKGDVPTPTFYRHDIGVAPGRFHEPSGDERGYLYTSPLDGSLWRYHVPTGRVEIRDLKEETGIEWRGLHLWPVAYKHEIYLCCPTLPKLWVYEWDLRKAAAYDLPPGTPNIYGGFAVPEWSCIYFYSAPLVGQKATPTVIKWDPDARQFTSFPCPYKLSGELYMSFADVKRREIWGSTYLGPDLVRFDARTNRWAGHWRTPLRGGSDTPATATPANKFVGNTLFTSDHLNGRLVPFDAGTGQWGEPIPVPGYREWFGYLSGGFAFRGLFYIVHSTWTGGTNSLDGKPHHFIGRLSVFDPRRKRFSQLDIPSREGEEFMADYMVEANGVLCILAADKNPPQKAIVLRSSPLATDK
jgi:hypothetical protein